MRVMPSSVELVRVSHAHFLGAWDPQVRPHVVGERAASWYLRMETLGAQARAGAVAKSLELRGRRPPGQRSTRRSAASAQDAGLHR